jgi:16S rRNA (guanine527-N7)-methyltransferase
VEPIEWISEALKKKGISFSAEALDRFRLYQTLIMEWNQKINLISKADLSRIVTRHFLESIGLFTVFQFPPKHRILDLGSGAGFPGLPLKIVQPDLEMVLVEATQKKVNFLEHVIKTLHLEGVEVASGRIETVFKKIRPVDAIVSRAVADLAALVRWSLLCIKQDGGKLIVIKGRGTDREIRQLQNRNFQQKASVCTVVPFNPFPEFFILRKSKVIIVHIKQIL